MTRKSTPSGGANAAPSHPVRVFRTAPQPTRHPRIYQPAAPGYGPSGRGRDGKKGR